MQSAAAAPLAKAKIVNDTDDQDYPLPHEAADLMQ
jgi:hypothetical protein